MIAKRMMAVLCIAGIMLTMISGDTAFAAADDKKPKVKALPKIGSVQNLIKLIGKPDENVVFYEATTDSTTAITGSAAAPPPMPTTAAETTTAANDIKQAAEPQTEYSTTNTQVLGVDESDVIKTDGEYIYYIRDNQVVMVKARPVDNMKLVGSIDFAGTDFNPQEMYVDGDHIVVIGNKYLYQPCTTAYVYDVSDKTKPQQIREVSVNGSYVSSRKIGDAIYMIANCYVYNLISDGKYIMPQYLDSSVNKKFININYDKISYFPGFVDRTYTTIAGFTLKGPDRAATIETYLGGGNNIYASQDNLYIATVSMQEIKATEPGVAASTSSSTSRSISFVKPFYSQKTTIYKFALENGSVTYTANGETDGSILNQFSMDEYKGYFRIATTSYSDKGEQTNNLFVFDENLALTGGVTDIAPGERIYSTRFMGDRGYMVTFRTVDPLFAIDLKDPKNPKILGALKIPGYSNYLHPYDENHLIGFGKDTTAVKDMAYYKGMKLSLFDVTDVSNPKELFTEIIGDRGTDSSLLNNHKALLFSKEKGLLAFPVNVYELSEKEKTDVTTYGQFTFQGAYVYDIGIEQGFKLRGKITHLTENDMRKSGMYKGAYNKYIERLLFINQDLYSVSRDNISANDIKTLKVRGSISLVK